MKDEEILQFLREYKVPNPKHSPKKVEYLVKCYLLYKGRLKSK